jgi:hypothetical protein
MPCNLHKFTTIEVNRESDSAHRDSLRIMAEVSHRRNTDYPGEINRRPSSNVYFINISQIFSFAVDNFLNDQNLGKLFFHLLSDIYFACASEHKSSQNA